MLTMQGQRGGGVGVWIDLHCQFKSKHSNQAKNCPIAADSIDVIDVNTHSQI